MEHITYDGEIIPKKSLERALELISDHRRWTQGTYWTYNNFATATCFCFIGALGHVFGIPPEYLRGGTGDFISANDCARTHAEALTALRKLIDQYPE